MLDSLYRGEVPPIPRERVEGEGWNRAEVCTPPLGGKQTCILFRVFPLLPFLEISCSESPCGPAGAFIGATFAPFKAGSAVS